MNINDNYFIPSFTQQRQVLTLVFYTHIPCTDCISWLHYIIISWLHYIIIYIVERWCMLIMKSHKLIKLFLILFFSVYLWWLLKHSGKCNRKPIVFLFKASPSVREHSENVLHSAEHRTYIVQFPGPSFSISASTDGAWEGGYMGMRLSLTK